MYSPKQRFPIRKSTPIPSPLEMQVDTYKLYKLAEDISDFKKKVEADTASQLEKINQVSDDTSKALAEVKRISQKIESEFDAMSSEIVSLLKEIKTQGLKGDKGEDGKDADEQKIVSEVSKMVPRSDEIVKDVLRRIPENKPSLKVIQESIDIGQVAEKVKQEIDIESFWKKKWNDIKAEISRSKQGYHGGGFNNILNNGTVVSTGLDNLNFTGATVTQSGRTVTVAVSSSGLTVLPATGTIDDSNVTFTFPSVPTLVVINGASYSSTSTVGGTLVWTNVGTTVTLAFPVGTGGSIYGL